VGRRAGALTETIDHGETGFLVDDELEAKLAIRFAKELDRTRVRRRVVKRFSPTRMTDEYEDVYRRLLGQPVPQSDEAPVGVGAG
jgi:glycosyltransferase involved in cell wall biosynthesis